MRYCFQHSGIKEAGTVPGGRRFEDIDDVTEFVPAGSSSTCNLRLEVVAHIHFLIQVDVIVDFFYVILSQHHPPQIALGMSELYITFILPGFDKRENVDETTALAKFEDRIKF